jgi:hypothetical protein
MAKHFYSDAILQESTAAVRNYTRKPDYVNHVNPNNLQVLINVGREKDR